LIHSRVNEGLLVGLASATDLKIQLKSRLRRLAWSNRATLALATAAVDAAYLARSKLPSGRTVDGTTSPISYDQPADLVAFHRYRSEFEKIGGSFWDGAIVTWDILLARQAAQGIQGDVLEIGVLKGKSATLIALHTRPHETFVLIDPALRREAVDAVESIHAANNLYLRDLSQNLRTHQALISRYRRFRWLHIDGEHSGPAVRNDLEIAAALVAPGGIICLDDFFTPAYPQITAAVFEFLASRRERLQLVLIGYNKGYICRCEDAAGNLSFLRDEAQREYARRDFAVTLWKTSSRADMNCFGVTGRVQNAAYKGPDWAPDMLPI
jgi:predicted O-methyltransferase YrrM